MRYMLDTNICLYLIRRYPPEVLRRLEALAEGEVCLSVVTYAELCAGLEIQSEQREHDRRVLAQLTRRIPVLPLDETGAESDGRLRAAVRDRHRDALDRLIAAHAIAAGSVLITNNEAAFAGYPGLRVGNWVNARTCPGPGESRLPPTSSASSRSSSRRGRPDCASAWGRSTAP